MSQSPRWFRSPQKCGRPSNSCVDNDDLLRDRLKSLGFSAPPNFFDNANFDDVYDMIESMACNVLGIDRKFFYMLPTDMEIDNSFLGNDVKEGSNASTSVIVLLTIVNRILNDWQTEPITLNDMLDPTRFMIKRLSTKWAAYADMRDCSMAACESIQSEINDKLKLEQNLMKELVELSVELSSYQQSSEDFRTNEDNIYATLSKLSVEITENKRLIQEYKFKIQDADNNTTKYKSTMAALNLEIREMDQQLQDSEKLTLEDCSKELKELEILRKKTSAEVAATDNDAKFHKLMNDITLCSVSNAERLHELYQKWIYANMNKDQLAASIDEKKKIYKQLESNLNQTTKDLKPYQEALKSVQDKFNYEMESLPNDSALLKEVEHFHLELAKCEHEALANEERLKELNQEVQVVINQEEKLKYFVMQQTEMAYSVRSKLQELKSYLSMYIDNGQLKPSLSDENNNFITEQKNIMESYRNIFEDDNHKKDYQKILNDQLCYLKSAMDQYNIS